MSSLGITRIPRNPVKYKLHHGQPAVGTWLSTCSPVVGEMMAHVGWDWLVMDAQHSPLDFATLVHSFRAIQLGGSVPMARVPWNDTIWIQRSLDAGAMGLVVPMTNSREETEQAVANFRYSTKGIRSFGGSRLANYVDGNYYDWAMANLAVIVMIETVEAVGCAEEILSVEGVDGCFIGPADLALSMGVGLSDTGPGTEHEALIQRVLAAGKKVGTAVGKHCTEADEVNMRIAQGFQFLACTSDASFMLKEANAAYASLRFDGGPLSALSAESGGLYP
jgi:4-hydroxy-2-oxoheptanedioate aldolase